MGDDDWRVRKVSHLGRSSASLGRWYDIWFRRGGEEVRVRMNGITPRRAIKRARRIISSY